jgi:uncharacterized membrane protein YfcA
LPLGGFAAGILGGLFGLGGGILVVPLLALGMGFKQQTAQGTSLLCVVAGSMVNTWVYFKHGSLPAMETWLWLWLAGSAGIFVSSRIALRSHPDTLKRLYGLYLIAMGVLFLWRP